MTIAKLMLSMYALPEGNREANDFFCKPHKDTYRVTKIKFVQLVHKSRSYTNMHVILLLKLCIEPVIKW
jgi:hypothetical protein